MIDLVKHAGGRYLTIGGRRYYSEQEGSAVYLTKCGSKDADTYEVCYSTGPEALTGPVNAGLSCECPDFMNRHRGTGGHGCKHVQALAAAGLLPSKPEPTEDELAAASLAYWDYFAEGQAEHEWRRFA